MIRQRPLSYACRLDERSRGGVDLLVIHCTELPDLAAARRYGEAIHYPRSRTGNSGHFYIDRGGEIEQWADTGRVAHHVRGFNPRSVGIELVNLGRYPDWYHSAHQEMREPYPPAQLRSLAELVSHLERACPELRFIAGHEDLDLEMVPSDDLHDVHVRRKLDPGPLFPWGEIMSVTKLVRASLGDL